MNRRTPKPPTATCMRNLLCAHMLGALLRLGASVSSACPWHRGERERLGKALMERVAWRENRRRPALAANKQYYEKKVGTSLLYTTLLTLFLCIVSLICRSIFRLHGWCQVGLAFHTTWSLFSDGRVL